MPAAVVFSRVVWLTLMVPAIAAAWVGCGGDAGAPGHTASLTPATPGRVSPASNAPRLCPSPATLPPSSSGVPPVPPLPDCWHVVGGGNLHFDIEPGAMAEFSPLTLFLGLRTQQPPCPSFFAHFAWASEPPADGLLVTEHRQGQAVPVGEGATGTGKGNCVTIRIANTSGAPTSVTVDYVVGETPPP